MISSYFQALSQSVVNSKSEGNNKPEKKETKACTLSVFAQV